MTARTYSTFLTTSSRLKSGSKVRLAYDLLDIDGISKEDGSDDKDSLKNNLNSFFKNLKLVVNRLHIRFEDDYLSGSKPFSIGILMEVFLPSYSPY